MLSLGEGAELVVDAHLGLVELGEALLHHARVRKEDAVHREAGSLHGVLVHFCF